MTREMVDRARLEAWMRGIGRAARRGAKILLTGGSTAVLEGWRLQTLDIDVSGDIDGILSELGKSKEEFNINLETAKPTDFVPSLPGESERHRFIERHGKVDFYHFDAYAQTFSKIVRGFPKDLDDARRMIGAGYVDLERLRSLVRGLSEKAYRPYIRLTRASVERTVEEFE